MLILVVMEAYYLHFFINFFKTLFLAGLTVIATFNLPSAAESAVDLGVMSILLYLWLNLLF